MTTICLPVAAAITFCSVATGGDSPVQCDPVLLTASQPGARAYFGFSMDIDGDNLVIGAPGDGGGSVEVTRSDGIAWRFQARLRSADPQFADSFGHAVDLDGDTLAVGVPGDAGAIGSNQGSVYVFKRVGGQWTQSAKIEPLEPTDSELFGWSIALDGDTLIVGAVQTSKAYVFTRSNQKWTHRATLFDDSRNRSEYFGWCVALEGDRAAVGARLANGPAGDAQGAVYTFKRNGNVWTREARLSSADAAPNRQLGNAVALEGQTLVASAYSERGVYVFRLNSGRWTQTDHLQPADPVGGQLSGTSVALRSGTLLIGAQYADLPGSTDQGAAYVFDWKGNSFVQRGTLTHPSPALRDHFGAVVATDGQSIAVSSFDDDAPAGVDQGSVVTYCVPAGCPADANADYLVNGQDLSIVLAYFGFAASGPGFGDLNYDGVCNSADLSILLASFATSCGPG